MLKLVAGKKYPSPKYPKPKYPKFQNTQAQNTQSPKIPNTDWNSHTNQLIESALTLKVSGGLYLLEFIDVLKDWWNENKKPQVKIVKENYLEQKNSRDAQKIWYPRGYPTKISALWESCNSPHKIFDTVRQNCDFSLHPHKIFGTLKNFKFQNGEFLKSWS